MGEIVSKQFDINKDRLLFVFIIFGFLWMSEEELGFDPTIMTVNDEQFIEIERNGLKEYIIIDREIKRIYCIIGRTTIYWKAYRKEDL